MGFKARPKLHDFCLCCDDMIEGSLTDNEACVTLSTVTLRELGLCKGCVSGDCAAEYLSDIVDSIDDYQQQIEALGKKRDAINAAFDRVNKFLS